MTSPVLNDPVAQQYEEWIYPEPIIDLPSWLKNNWQWFDPSHAHRLFWPDREYRADLDILIAGCGTNQAAVFAYTNRGAKVTAIDVSKASLAHHRFLKEKYSLDNLDLHQLPIEQVGELDRDYDLVVSTGVLHHMADPKQGMKALASCLRPEGVAAIMLYAHYGRIGVEMLQGVFRNLGLTQDNASLEVVKRAITVLPEDHPLRSYLRIAPDLQFDAGLVDTFLHGRDRSYTVTDCLDLVHSAGLVFQDWLLKSSYEPLMIGTDPFINAIAGLPKEQRWAVMERINHRNACHFFMACRADRLLETYRVDFGTDRWLEAVPLFRYRCGLEGDTIARPDWRMRLAGEELAIVELIDGHRTCGQILDIRTRDNQVDSSGEATFMRNFLQLLVNYDFLSMALET